MNKLVTDINVASSKGLSERFDSTIGAGTVPCRSADVTSSRPWQAMVQKNCR